MFGGAPTRVDSYDGAVAFVDQQIGALVTELAEDGIDRSTLAVVTADHGEGLGDHGFDFHRFLLYEEAVRIPLIFTWPGRIVPGLVAQDPVSIVNVFPTILGLLDIPLPARTEGRSLAARLLGGRHGQGPPIWLDRGRVHHRREEAQHAYGVRHGRWKLLFDRQGRAELFDLATDPGELHNIATKHPARVEELSRLLDEHRDGEAREARRDLTSDEERALRALGYLH
jgi:arylsulfatase A-like enzyme